MRRKFCGNSVATTPKTARRSAISNGSIPHPFITSTSEILEKLATSGRNLQNGYALWLGSYSRPEEQSKQYTHSVSQTPIWLSTGSPRPSGRGLLVLGLNDGVATGPKTATRSAISSGSVTYRFIISPSSPASRMRYQASPSPRCPTK